MAFRSSYCLYAHTRTEHPPQAAAAVIKMPPPYVESGDAIGLFGRMDRAAGQCRNALRVVTKRRKIVELLIIGNAIRAKAT